MTKRFYSLDCSDCEYEKTAGNFARALGIKVAHWALSRGHRMNNHLTVTDGGVDRDDQSDDENEHVVMRSPIARMFEEIQTDLGLDDREFATTLRLVADEFTRARERRYVMSDFSEGDTVSFLNRTAENGAYGYENRVGTVDAVAPWPAPDLDGGELQTEEMLRIRSPREDEVADALITTIHPRMVTGHYDQSPVDEVWEWLLAVDENPSPGGGSGGADYQKSGHPFDAEAIDHPQED